MEKLTKAQARRFLLCHQGLLGPYVFKGSEGILRYARQAGCIQYDPLDVCGKNAELVLQARVKDFEKPQLDAALYKDRQLMDEYDKNMSIIPLEDWPRFARLRAERGARMHSAQAVEAVEKRVLAHLEKAAYACSKDLPFTEKVDWSWQATALSRAALETLYTRGKLVIHHKKNAVKYYALAEKVLPEEILGQADPFPDDFAFECWRVERRIGAVGLLWARPSDAFLGIHGLRGERRRLIFDALTAQGRICPVQVEGVEEPLYLAAAQLPALHAAREEGHLRPRTELLAPLDNLLWDRELIRRIFDFDYKWEVYTPVRERRYGYYVLPLLHGERLIGRAELRRDAKNGILHVLGLWYEKDLPAARIPHRAVEACLERLARFNGCGAVALAKDGGFAEKQI